MGTGCMGREGLLAPSSFDYSKTQARFLKRASRLGQEYSVEKDCITVFSVSRNLILIRLF